MISPSQCSHYWSKLYQLLSILDIVYCSTYLVVTFLFTTKQEADVVVIDTAHYLDKNLTWQQFTLELRSLMQQSVCDLIK